MTDPAPTRTVARRSRSDLAVLRVLAILGVMMIHVIGLTTTNDDLRGTRLWRALRE